MIVYPINGADHRGLDAPQRCSCGADGRIPQNRNAFALIEHALRVNEKRMDRMVVEPVFHRQREPHGDR